MSDQKAVREALSAKKRFGQNFLNDQNIIGNILQAIHPQPDDHIVEIGPGHGALTYPLINAVNHLHVVEIDRDLIRELRLSGAYALHKFTLHEGDALKLDFSNLANEITKQDSGLLRLVGNLPYNISTPLLFHLSSARHRIQDAHFMLQKEVVERMSASPNCKSYGRLTVMIQALFTVEPLFVVPPTAFSPPPKVQSQIVRLKPLQRSATEKLPSESFAKVVRTAFSARRKTLRKGLKGIIDEAGFADCGIDPSLRPENLSVQQYIELSHHAINCL